MKGLDKRALQHLRKNRPAEIDQLANLTRSNANLFWLANSLKVSLNTDEFVFTKERFEIEFNRNKSKYYHNYLLKRLKELGIKKPRIVYYEGEYHIWKND